MRRAAEKVWDLLEPEIQGLGYEFVGAVFGQAENGTTLRVYIDSEAGIGLEDCARVSRQVSALLDVEDVIDVAYLLEVSSPGVDRPLFTPMQFSQAVGAELRVRMAIMVGGRRRFNGTLVGVHDEKITVECDGQPFVLKIADIESARLVPQFD